MIKSCRGEGDLLGEPTIRNDIPLVRLTDLEPRLQDAWRASLTFARDPKALYELLKLQWGLWERYGLGISKVSAWRDGIASNTGFPGTHGMLRSANGPQEAQMRGMLHRHTIIFPLQRLGVRELQAFALERVEEYMKAVLQFVQRSQFASGVAVARVGFKETSSRLAFFTSRQLSVIHKGFFPWTMKRQGGN